MNILLAVFALLCTAVGFPLYFAGKYNVLVGAREKSMIAWFATCSALCPPLDPAAHKGGGCFSARERHDLHRAAALFGSDIAASTISSIGKRMGPSGSCEIIKRYNVEASFYNSLFEKFSYRCAALFSGLRRLPLVPLGVVERLSSE